jgi:hypothetical protein
MFTNTHNGEPFWLENVHALGSRKAVHSLTEEYLNEELGISAWEDRRKLVKRRDATEIIEWYRLCHSERLSTGAY